MQGSTKIPITDLNAYITCKICSGYFVDASTIIECLHTFCRSCIIKYFQKNKYCPVCDVQVHKSKPLLNIRPDKTVQDIVYKLVPRLFQNEMQRRREFYNNHPEAKPSSLEQCGEVAYQHLLTPEETICLTLSYHGADNKPRYLRCPAAVTMGHLKKLIRAKYGLSDSHRVDIFYNQDCLSSSLTLMDVAYIYLWKRKGPIELTYRIYENTAKKMKLEVPDHHETTGTNVANNNNNNNNDNISNNNNWKEVQLRISENGEMSITGIQDAALSPSLLEIVNSEPKYKSDVTDVTTLVDTQSVNNQTPCKKEVPGLKYIGKVNTTSTSLLNNIAVSSHTISLGNLTNSYTSVSLPTFVDPIISTPITCITLSTKSNFLTVSLPSSSSSCATLSSGSTTMVFSTINTTKCSTKTEDSILKAAQPNINEINSEKEIEKPLKRKLEPNIEVEPPAKQSKPIILNHNIGLLNLSNNHPLKKHSKLNRNGENVPKVTCVPETKITNVVTTSTVTILNSTSLNNFSPLKKFESDVSKPNIINKSISSIQRPGTPTSTTKPLALRAKTLISESGVKPPCYQPRTVYGTSINVPRPVTSTTTVSVVSGSISVSKSDGKLTPVQKPEKSVTIISNQHSQSKQNNNKIPITAPCQHPQPVENTTNTNSTVNKHQQSTTSTNKIQSISGIRPVYSDSGKCNVLSIHSFPPPQTTQGTNIKTTSPSQLQPTVTSIANAVSKTTVSVTASPPQQPIQNTSNKVSNTTIKTKPSTPIGYKTLRDPPKSWNSQISKANLSKSSPDSKFSDLKNVRPAKFFKMRNNMPRYLGNPASGVKPMYQVHVSPEKEKPAETAKSEKTEIKKHSIVKIDPKTLKPVSEKAPETTSLSNHNSVQQNITNQSLNNQLYPTQCLNSSLNIPNNPGMNLQNDLKINTSSVSIFNPLKLQSSPKNERRSPKSPHSPKIKASNSPTGNKRDKVNLNFTPPNPFVPNIPSKTLSPTQFIYPSMPPGFTPYDPRVMAAYYSQWYGQQIGFPPAALPGLNLDLNQRKGLDILTSPSSPKMDPLTQSMLNHQMPIRPPPLASTSTSSRPRNHNTSLSSTTITKPPSVSKKSSKESKNEKSLETVVEKMTQNLNKMTGQTQHDTSSPRKKEAEVNKMEMQKNSPQVMEKFEKGSSKGNSEHLVDQKRELNKTNNANDKVDSGTNQLLKVATSDTDVHVPVSNSSKCKVETKTENPVTLTPATIPQPPVTLNATVATVVDTSDSSISTKTPLESDKKQQTVEEVAENKRKVTNQDK